MLREPLRNSLKEGTKDAFARIIESKRATAKDPENFEFNPLRVSIALCCYNGYKWTCYIGALTYLIISIIYLIIFHSMIRECEAQRNLWYYLLLSQCAIYGSTFWNKCIQKTKCAKSYLKILRYVVVTTVAFVFGSYGTVVLALADPNNISQKCNDSMPYKFTDLIYATDILAYVTGSCILYSIFYIFDYPCTFIHSELFVCNHYPCTKECVVSYLKTVK